MMSLYIKFLIFSVFVLVKALASSYLDKSSLVIIKYNFPIYIGR
jgi:hypothetical protein